MNIFLAAMAVVDLINKGGKALDMATSLAGLIQTRRDEGKTDLSPEEVQPYLDELGTTLDEMDAMVKRDQEAGDGGDGVSGDGAT